MSAALRLDGNGQPVLAIAIEGEAVSANRWRLEGGDLVIADPPEDFVARNRNEDRTQGQY